MKSFGKARSTTTKIHHSTKDCQEKSSPVSSTSRKSKSSKETKISKERKTLKVIRGERITSPMSDGGTFFRELGSISFPEPTGISINMMPFVAGDIMSIPVEYLGYAPLIERCCNTLRSSYRREIFYLTIQESFVEHGRSQRRSGLHTDRHKAIAFEAGGDEVIGRGKGDFTFDAAWGGRDITIGGIFLASNVGSSCAVWDAYISSPGVLGDCEDCRAGLGEPHLLLADTLYWITDGTPHEALPLTCAAERQFFRVVTAEVGIWYSQHSTANPLGVVPPDSVRIFEGNKFDDGPSLK